MTTARDYGIAPPEYRLPDSTHVGSVLLQVSDLQRSVDYYTRVIGLCVVERDTRTAALAAAGADPPLLRLQTTPGVYPAPRRGTLGLFHFAILLPDRAALGRFLTHVAARGVRVGAADHLVSEALYLTDPDGLGIEVYADSRRETWRHANRELAMTTDPLDMAALSAAAAGEAWSGAPAGTRMGHMHLHVGDLTTARHFYHEALGFDVTVWSYPGALFFSAGGYHHHLATNTWAPPAPAEASQARLMEWELIVPEAHDAAAAAMSLIKAGYAATRAGATWTAADPWGTTVVLRAP